MPKKTEWERMVKRGNNEDNETDKTGVITKQKSRKEDSVI
jgi:hypothetical protein